MVGLIFLSFLLSLSCAQPYEPNWESLETRPIPEWFRELKFGIFIHWGVYAVPAYGCAPGATSGEWYERYMTNNMECLMDFHNRNYNGAPYRSFGPQFHAELWNPEDWADLFERSGANYIVITSKHHDGYALWDSAYAPEWNSVDVGPGRDLLSELFATMRNRTSLRLGLYHSLMEWTDPRYLQDATDGTRVFPTTHLLPMMRELVEKFEPDILWPDGEWERPYTYWGSTDFLAWLYNESPVRDHVVVNDRWDNERPGRCVHSCVHTVESTAGEFDPDHIWEECRTMSNPLSWGYNRNLRLEDYESPKEMIEHLVRTVAFNGNLLLNVGPESDGRIPVIQEERLLQIGEWMSVNNEAIYNTRYWDHPNEPNNDVFYTQSTIQPDVVYAISLVWPEDELILREAVPTERTTVSLLGSDEHVHWRFNESQFFIQPPRLSVNELPSPYAWTFKLTDVNPA